MAANLTARERARSARVTMCSDAIADSLPEELDRLEAIIEAALLAHGQQVRREALEEAKALLTLATRLQYVEHNSAVHSYNTIFTKTSQQGHGAGESWPDVDDGSYFAIENCQHDDCKTVRDAAIQAASEEPK